MLFGFGVEFFFAEHGKNLHLLHDLANVLDRMHYVAGASFTLGANHGRAFGNSPQRFAQIARAANERNLERMLVDVMGFVSRRQHFRFIDVIHTKLLQNLGLGEVADAALRHYRNRHGGHDLANLFG